MHFGIIHGHISNHAMKLDEKKYSGKKDVKACSSDYLFLEFYGQAVALLPDPEDPRPGLAFITPGKRPGVEERNCTCPWQMFLRPAAREGDLLTRRPAVWIASYNVLTTSRKFLARTSWKELAIRAYFPPQRISDEGIGMGFLLLQEWPWGASLR